MKLHPLAAALLCAAPAVHAEDPDSLSPVIVTASRFQTSIAAAPVNITVIDSQHIEESGATNLAQVLEAEPGVHVADLFGIGGAKTTVDMGGFGATGAQNTLILVNGRRLNDVDLEGANFASIPVEAIDRIEILHGSGTILYGDNATSGVINIVTKTGFEGNNRITLGAGSFGTERLAVETAKSNDNDAFSLTADGMRSSGYRDHNDFKKASVAGEWTHNDGDLVSGIRFNSHYEDLNLPGALYEAAFKQDPTQASASLGFATEQRQGIEAFWNGPHTAAELSYSHKTQNSELFGGKFDADLGTWGFTPRFNNTYANHSVVTGMDLYSSNLDTHSDFSSSGALNASKATRKSIAVYATDTATDEGPWSIDVGGRIQQVSFNVDNHDLIAGASSSDSRNDTLRAFDAGLSYRHANKGRSYVRISDTFRFPVLDEVWNYFSGTINLLAPQHGKQLEIGTQQPLSTDINIQARVFEANLNDEIGLDPATYSNVNLDPTRHTGADVSIHAKLGDITSGTLGYAYRKAVFRSGPYDGKIVPEIPQNRFTAELDWKWPADGLHLDAVYTGERYFGDDFANAGKRMSSFTMLNGAWTHKWTPSVKTVFTVRNITDTKTADSGYYFPNPDPMQNYSFYPLPGRSFFAEVQAGF